MDFLRLLVTLLLVLVAYVPLSLLAVSSRPSLHFSHNEIAIRALCFMLTNPLPLATGSTRNVGQKAMATVVRLARPGKVLR